MRHFDHFRIWPNTADGGGLNTAASPNGTGKRKMLKFGLLTSKSRNYPSNGECKSNYEHR